MKLPSAMLGFLLPSPYPGQLKSDWQCVTNLHTRKHGSIKLKRGKWREISTSCCFALEITSKMTRCSVRPTRVQICDVDVPLLQ